MALGWGIDVTKTGTSGRGRGAKTEGYNRKLGWDL